MPPEEETMHIMITPCPCGRCENSILSIGLMGSKVLELEIGGGQNMSEERRTKLVEQASALVLEAFDGEAVGQIETVYRSAPTNKERKRD